MTYNKIPLLQMKPLEFKPYHGPPTPKPSSQPPKSKKHASSVAGEQNNILNFKFESAQDQASKFCLSQSKNNLEDLIVIEDSQSEPDSDKDNEYLPKSGGISQMINTPESVYISATGDTIESNQLDEPNSTPSYSTVNDSLLKKRHDSYTNEDGGTSAKKIELHDKPECRDTFPCQPMQQSTCRMARKVTVPLKPQTDETKRKDSFPVPKIVPDPNIHVGNSDNGTPHDTISMRKRRRISSTTTISRKRSKRNSYTAPKQHFRNAKSATGRHKQGQNHSRVLHLGADPNNSDEDVEYEVEKILDSRVDDNGILQYRVEWVGYPQDQTWYNAGNFKNSPYKILEYHKGNDARPGPPQMLGWWRLCWNEGKNAEDHPNDDKAE